MCQKDKMTIDKQSIHNWDAASHAYDLQNETRTFNPESFHAFMQITHNTYFSWLLHCIIKHKSKILQDKKSLHWFYVGDSHRAFHK